MKLKEGAKRRANREDEAIKGSKERWQREKMRLKEGTRRGTNTDGDVKGGEQREGKTEKTDSCL